MDINDLLSKPIDFNSQTITTNPRGEFEVVKRVQGKEKQETKNLLDAVVSIRKKIFENPHQFPDDTTFNKLRTLGDRIINSLHGVDYQTESEMMRVINEIMHQVLVSKWSNSTVPMRNLIKSACSEDPYWQSIFFENHFLGDSFFIIENTLYINSEFYETHGNEEQTIACFETIRRVLNDHKTIRSVCLQNGVCSPCKSPEDRVRVLQLIDNQLKEQMPLIDFLLAKGKFILDQSVSRKEKTNNLLDFAEEIKKIVFQNTEEFTNETNFHRLGKLGESILAALEETDSQAKFTVSRKITEVMQQVLFRKWSSSDQTVTALIESLFPKNTFWHDRIVDTYLFNDSFFIWQGSLCIDFNFYQTEEGPTRTKQLLKSIVEEASTEGTAIQSICLQNGFFTPCKLPEDLDRVMKLFDGFTPSKAHSAPFVLARAGNDTCAIPLAPQLIELSKMLKLMVNGIEEDEEKGYESSLVLERGSYLEEDLVLPLISGPILELISEHASHHFRTLPITPENISLFEHAADYLQIPLLRKKCIKLVEQWEEDRVNFLQLIDSQLEKQIPSIDFLLAKEKFILHRFVSQEEKNNDLIEFVDEIKKIVFQNPEDFTGDTNFYRLGELCERILVALKEADSQVKFVARVKITEAMQHILFRKWPDSGLTMTAFIESIFPKDTFWHDSIVDPHLLNNFFFIWQGSLYIDFNFYQTEEGPTRTKQLLKSIAEEASREGRAIQSVCLQNGFFSPCKLPEDLDRVMKLFDGFTHSKAHSTPFVLARAGNATCAIPLAPQLIELSKILKRMVKGIEEEDEDEKNESSFALERGSYLEEDLVLPLISGPILELINEHASHNFRTLPITPDVLSLFEHAADYLQIPLLHQKCIKLVEQWELVKRLKASSLQPGEVFEKLLIRHFLQNEPVDFSEYDLSLFPNEMKRFFGTYTDIKGSRRLSELTWMLSEEHHAQKFKETFEGIKGWSYDLLGPYVKHF